MEKNNLAIKLEELIYSNDNLLEIAKTYCESNYDKGAEIIALFSILEIVLKNHKEVIEILDNLFIINDYV